MQQQHTSHRLAPSHHVAAAATHARRRQAVLCCSCNWEVHTSSATAHASAAADGQGAAPTGERGCSTFTFRGLDTGTPATWSGQRPARDEMSTDAHRYYFPLPVAVSLIDQSSPALLLRWTIRSNVAYRARGQSCPGRCPDGVGTGGRAGQHQDAATLRSGSSYTHARLGLGDARPPSRSG